MSSDGAIHGVSFETVREAVATEDPLVGTREGHEGCRGYAAVLAHPDGAPTYVRDVLGRYPLFVERADPTVWSFARSDLAEPVAVPAGHVATPADDQLLADGVWTLPEHAAVAREDGYWDGVEPYDGLESARPGLQSALESAFRSVPGETAAVAFSGGVDSAVIAAEFDGPCYAAGFDGSHDLDAARSAAETLGSELETVTITHEDIERAARTVRDATGRSNPMDVSIAVPLYLVGERAAADGFDRLLLGQGADELFGGYEKVLEPNSDGRVEAETVHGAVRESLLGLPEGLERDVSTLREAGIEPVFPYLDDRVVRSALRLPERCLVSGDVRKSAFRRVARHWVPAGVADREKKAVQYGSLVSRELDRLARQAGFKRRLDDHVGQYVRSL